MRLHSSGTTPSAANPKPSLRLGLALLLTALLTLSACSPAGPADSNVKVTSPTVASQGQLSLHSTATFTASVPDPNGLYQAADLSYHWSLDEERGTFLPDGDDEATEVVTTSASLRVRGDRAGAETVRVTVVDTSTDSTIGVGTLAFNITTPSTTSDCFDAATLFVAYSSTTTNSDTINMETGERTFFTSGLVTDVSRDGNWVTGISTSKPGVKSHVFILRCDGTSRRSLTNGEHYEERAAFSPDGQSIYFLRRSADENVLYPGDGRSGYMEFWVVDVATGVSRILTDMNKDAEGAQDFAISPDGETIVFAHLAASVGGPGASFEYDYNLVTMPAGGGPLHSLTNLGDYVPVDGIDWSPDGRDIIFSWNASHQSEPTGESGIYRIHPTAGGGPQLIFPDPSPDSLPPSHPTYYAGGTRIAWTGQEYGQTKPEVWSIDANGADVKQLTDDVGHARLQAIWDPY